MDNATQRIIEANKWILWKEVWEKAVSEFGKDVHGKNPTDNAILQSLAIELDLSEKNLRRYHNRQDLKPGDKTAKAWLKYTRGMTIKEYVALCIGADTTGRPGFEPADEHAYPDIDRSGIKEEAEAVEPTLLTTLTDRLKDHYKQDGPFTSIGLIPDSKGLFDKLPMDSDFIQLSYVKQADAKSRDSLIKCEAELNRYKIRRTIAGNQKISRDYILHYQFNELKQLLIIGTPGVGKSTLSRWLCHEWARYPGSYKVVPVFVELKRLMFTDGGNSLASYIAETYGATGHTAGDWLVMLKQDVASICLVLDGYDELSEENKKRLTQSLADISVECRYILTSRPYGVLNTHGLSFTDIIQVDGLDQANIQKYIGNFLDKLSGRNGLSKEKLLAIIDRNPTLADFAHNPLLLSFIVVIYMTRDDADNVLTQVQSRYDLQRLVIGWMLAYNDNEEMSKPFIREVSQIACGMELRKEFELADFGFDTRNSLRSLLIPLARIGIGQLAEYDNGYYKFYFNSIGFQEFFAAVALQDKITIDAFEYLLKDVYFINLCAMLVGSLADKDLLRNLIDLVEKKIKDNRLSSDEPENDIYYKYVLLLSELKREFLSDIMTPEKLKWIYDSFRANTIGEQQAISLAISECLLRLYSKLDLQHQSTFKKIILDELSDFLETWTDEHLGAWYDKHNHIPDLINKMGIWNDTDFCISITELLVKALEQEENSAVQEDNIDFTMIDVIQAYEPEHLITDERYVHSLKKIVQLLPERNISNRSHFQHYYTPVREAIGQLNTLLDGYVAGEEEHDNELLIGKILTCCYIIARNSSKGWGQMTTEADEQAFDRGVHFFFNYLRKRALTEEGQDDSLEYVYYYIDLIYLAANTLLETGRQKYCDLALQLFPISRHIGTMEIELINTAGVSGYFESLINDTPHSNIDSCVEQIVLMIQHVPALKNKVAFHREDIYSMVKTYLEKNEVSLYVARDKQRAHAIIQKLDAFFEMLRDDEYKIYHTDKHYFIRRLLEDGFGKYDDIKNDTWTIFIDNIDIYDALYWEHIFYCMQDPVVAGAKNMLYALTNNTIYRYKSNTPYLAAVLDIIWQKQDLWTHENELKAVISIVEQTLVMIVKNNMNDHNTQKMVRTTGLILKTPLVQKAVLEHCTNMRWTDTGLAAFLLQYFLTQQDIYHLRVDYSAVQQSNRAGYDKLLKHIKQAFYGHKNPGQTMNFILSATGVQFVADLEKKLTTFRFDVAAFEKLCRAC